MRNSRIVDNLDGLKVSLESLMMVQRELMAIHINNTTRDDLNKAKNGSWFWLLGAILVLLIGLIVLGMFHRKTESDSERPASQAAGPASPDSASGDSASLLVHPLSTSKSAVLRRIKLEVVPPGATYALGEPSVFFVNIQTARLPSRGSVTLVYDPNVIEVNNVRPPLGPAPFGVTSRIENRSGSATVNVTSTATAQEKQAQIGLFSVEFVGIGVGRSAVVLTVGAFTDAQGSSVPVEISNGEVEISGQ